MARPTISTEHGAGAELLAESTCPHCGSSALLLETRDAWPDKHGNLPPREAYGRWIVCASCRREWPDDGR